MKHQGLVHDAASGWRAPLPANLDSARTLVLAFSAPDLAQDSQPFVDLAAAFPSAVVIGCSTSGEIADQRVHDGSVSVAVAQFDHTDLRLASTRIDGIADSYSAGARLARELVSDDLRAVFVLSGGLEVNGTQLVDGLAAGVKSETVITGGLAGDCGRFATTWIYAQGERRSQHACAVGLYGNRLRVGHGFDIGCLAFGPERRITRSVGNELFELDEKPALDLYKAYLGERAAGLPGTALLFPLTVRRDVSDPGELVRTILAVDEDAKSLRFAGDIPQGGIARLMRVNTEKLIGSAGEASRRALAPLLDAQDALLISVSCIGRRMVLGERTDEEIEAVLDNAPPRTTHVGFYSYGEISPGFNRCAELHNQTMTVTAFGEV